MRKWLTKILSKKNGIPYSYYYQYKITPKTGVKDYYPNGILINELIILNAWENYKEAILHHAIDGRNNNIDYFNWTPFHFADTKQGAAYWESVRDKLPEKLFETGKRGSNIPWGMR